MLGFVLDAASRIRKQFLLFSIRNQMPKRVLLWLCGLTPRQRAGRPRLKLTQRILSYIPLLGCSMESTFALKCFVRAFSRQPWEVFTADSLQQASVAIWEFSGQKQSGTIPVICCSNQNRRSRKNKDEDLRCCCHAAIQFANGIRFHLRP